MFSALGLYAQHDLLAVLYSHGNVLVLSPVARS